MRAKPAAESIAVANEVSFSERHAGRIRSVKIHVKTFSKNTSAMLGLAIVLFFLTIAAIGPWIVPFPEDAMGSVNLDIKLQSPSSIHWFGTDEVGNDIFTRVVLGTRVTLQIALIVTGVAMLIGVPLGMIAGLTGGYIQEIIMRTTDIFLSIPGLVLAIAIVGALGPGIVNAMLALSLVWWPGYVRLIQAKTLSLKNEIYVESARAVGASQLRIVFVHILPNCTSPIVVKASMDMGMAILGAASLGFLGLGAQPPYPEWGAMISIARTYLPDWWWYSFFPGMAISLTVLGFNLLGDGLRDILDPQYRD